MDRHAEIRPLFHRTSFPSGLLSKNGQKKDEGVREDDKEWKKGNGRLKKSDGKQKE